MMMMMIEANCKSDSSLQPEMYTSFMWNVTAASTHMMCQFKKQPIRVLCMCAPCFTENAQNNMW